MNRCVHAEIKSTRVDFFELCVVLRRYGFKGRGFLQDEFGCLINEKVKENKKGARCMCGLNEAGAPVIAHHDFITIVLLELGTLQSLSCLQNVLIFHFLLKITMERGKVSRF